MQLLSLVFVFGLIGSTVNFAGSFGLGDPKGIDPDVRQVIEGPLTQVGHWKDIPGSVRDVLTKEWKDDRIADVNEPFDPTCTGPSGLPHMHLLLAARGPEVWLVYYESGGIAHSFHLALVQLQDGSVKGKPLVIGLFPPPATDLDSLRKAIRQHRYLE
jgi:hypothetical protein